MRYCPVMLLLLLLVGCDSTLFKRRTWTGEHIIFGDFEGHTVCLHSAEGPEPGTTQLDGAGFRSEVPADKPFLMTVRVEHQGSVARAKAHCSVEVDGDTIRIQVRGEELVVTPPPTERLHSVLACEVPALPAGEYLLQQGRWEPEALQVPSSLDDGCIRDWSPKR